MTYDTMTLGQLLRKAREIRDAMLAAEAAGLFEEAARLRKLWDRLQKLIAAARTAANAVRAGYVAVTAPFLAAVLVSLVALGGGVYMYQKWGKPTDAPIKAGARGDVTARNATASILYTTGSVPRGPFVVYVKEGSTTCCSGEGGAGRSPYRMQIGSEGTVRADSAAKVLSAAFPTSDAARAWVCQNHKVAFHYWGGSIAKVKDVVVTNTGCEKNSS